MTTSEVKELINSFKYAITSGFPPSPSQIIREHPEITTAHCYFDDCDNATALHIAAWHLKRDLVEQLIDAGSAVDAKDDFGRTALHVAAGQRFDGEQNKVLAYLLSKGADVNAKDNAGQTPLHHNAAGDACSIGLLLEAGADLTIKDSTGRTPAKVFDGFGQARVQDYLKKHQTKRWWEFWK